MTTAPERPVLDEARHAAVPPRTVLPVADPTAPSPVRRTGPGRATAEERVAVELYVIEEMPAEAVAKVVGWPNAKAVYNHVYRALAAMRQRLQQAGLRADL